MGEAKFDSMLQFGVTVIILGPEFASAYQGAILELQEIPEMAEVIDPPLMVLDLSRIEYFGSAFIAFLIMISKKVRARPGGRFAVSGLTTFAEMALHTSKVDEVLTVFESTTDAVEALAKTRENA
ncbi:MAG: hypothetical protein O3A00_15810 [Planctomycetota bacterium]|nr:hypothetical protein [Planctomycetota bacterium]